MTIEPVTAEFARTNRIPEERRGLRVTDVSQSGPARGRLGAADVLVEVLFPEPKLALRTPADLQGVLGKLDDGDYVSLLVYNAQTQGTRVVNLRIGEQ